MARPIKTIDYDAENDIFFISNEEKVKTSLDIGDFVLDVNYNNLISGIEIMDASENLGVLKDMLKNIKSVKMAVTYKTNHVYVLLMAIFERNNKKVNISIPLTLDLGHKAQKKDVLVYN